MLASAADTAHNPTASEEACKEQRHDGQMQPPDGERVAAPH